MKLGCLLGTRKIDLLMQKSNQFSEEINEAINKFINHDWGDTCPEDELLNNLALITVKEKLLQYILLVISGMDNIRICQNTTTILFLEYLR